MNQLYTYRYPLPFGLPSQLGYHSALDRLPCAICSHQLSILYIVSIMYMENTYFWCVAQGGLSLLIVTSHCWFLLTSLLTQTLEFLFMALLLSQFPHSGFGQRCLRWTYWSSCASVIKPTLIFPWSLVYLFVYFRHAFLTAFSFLVSGFSISPCPLATPNYSISNLITNFRLLLTDVGIYRF